MHAELALEIFPVRLVFPLKPVVENHITVAPTAIRHIVESLGFFKRGALLTRWAHTCVEAARFCRASVETQVIQASIAEHDVPIASASVSFVSGPLGVVGSVDPTAHSF